MKNSLLILAVTVLQSSLAHAENKPWITCTTMGETVFSSIDLATSADDDAFTAIKMDIHGLDGSEQTLIANVATKELKKAQSNGNAAMTFVSAESTSSGGETRNAGLLALASVPKKDKIGTASFAYAGSVYTLECRQSN